MAQFPGEQTRYNSFMAYKVLIVDDEVTLLNTVHAYLEQEGYAVQTATDGRSALLTFRDFQPDLVVLDIMLPEIDGLEVLRQLRQRSDVYVIMLTAKADEADKIIGLGLGADDYLTKPFSPRELVARIKAALRRLGGGSAKKELVSARLRLDEEARLAWKDGQPLDLTPIEFDLLQTLMDHHGRALSREQLIEQVWGYDYYGDERVVDVHIGRLRKKVEDDPAQPTFIATVWGAGYRFEDEMR
jgi:DNA-binding response OmpR family regulator